jgi:hypothetical protein
MSFALNSGHAAAGGGVDFHEGDTQGLHADRADDRRRDHSILAAVALPAYQDYTVRARVSELMLASTMFKTTVAEKAMSDTTLASSASD